MIATQRDVRGEGGSLALLDGGIEQTPNSKLRTRQLGSLVLTLCRWALALVRTTVRNLLFGRKLHPNFHPRAPPKSFGNLLSTDLNP